MNVHRLTLAIFFSIILILTDSFSVTAGEINDDVGTSSFPFLKINVGARAVGMGGAFTGLADDESALYYNPAGIVSFEENRFIAGYHNYFEDLQSGFVGYIRNYGDNAALGFYASYLNYGNFVRTDISGSRLGEFGGGDFLLAVSGAMHQGYDLSFGATVKFISETLEDFSSTGLAADVGMLYSRNRNRFTFGLAIQNLGTQLSGLDDETYSLPLTVRGGISARPRGLPVILAADIIAPVDNDIIFAVGTEYWELRPLYIRLGWNSFGSNYRTLDSDDSWAGLGFGFGVDIRNFQISYAFSPGAELGDSHRITITGGL